MIKIDFGNGHCYFVPEHITAVVTTPMPEETQVCLSGGKVYKFSDEGYAKAKEILVGIEAKQ